MSDTAWGGEERRKKPRGFSYNPKLTLGCECLGEDQLVPYCLKMKKLYGELCPRVCQFLKDSYRKIWQDDRPEASRIIEIMDEKLVFIKSGDEDSGKIRQEEMSVIENIRTQAQILMMSRQEIAHQTRVSMGKKRISKDDLGMTFIVNGLHDCFRDQWWKLMLEEINDDKNKGYARETFLRKREEMSPNASIEFLGTRVSFTTLDKEKSFNEERGLSIIELFWQYRYGGGIEFFKKHHPHLFPAPT